MLDVFIFVLGKTAKCSKTQTNRDCILMDEVDGMAGNEDRGGIQVRGKWENRVGD